MLERLLGVSSRQVAFFLRKRSDVAQRLSDWISKQHVPVSVGDALSVGLLCKLLGVSPTQAIADFVAECRTSEGLYLPLPASDERWGMVVPVADVFSTSQGLLASAVLSDDMTPLMQGRTTLEGYIADLPILASASSTSPEHRKLSELLMQAHYCATLASLPPDTPISRKLLDACRNALDLAISHEYANTFATPIFRLVALTRMAAFGLGRDTRHEEWLLPSINRLRIGDGVGEYQVSDKVDERARSRSRSSLDQAHPWTYSCAYAVLSLRLSGIADPILAILEQELLRRLTGWPDLEPSLVIKEFQTPLAPGSSAYGALCAVAAVSSGCA